MSYLAKPGGDVVHIYSHFRELDGIPALRALCPTSFLEPSKTAYFASDRAGRKVCGHCARMARRRALYLLAEAEGRPL